MHNIGDEVYYITFFNKLKKVKIVDKKRVATDFDYGYVSHKTLYIVEFKSGRLKIIDENKIF